MDLKDFLKVAVEKNASDLHITTESSPIIRIDGRLIPLSDFPKLNREDCKRLVYSVLNDKQKAVFERELELDFSLEVPGLNRFRVNVHMQRGSVEAAFRLVSIRIKSLEELGLPPVVTELSRRNQGLVLITGPTGVGKTTTLSAMVNLINNERQALIISVEDPIEYVHVNKCSIIKQREVYSDTKSFSNALTHALRQDPNVIVVGEMRNLDTISTALTAAETGHLVLATLHTPDAPQTIDRIIDVFPPYQQQQVKIQLAGSLQAVVSQQLLPRKDRGGRVIATEIMIATSAIKNLIREHQTEQLPTHMQTGSKYGMHTMDKSLKTLYQKGIISEDTYKTHICHPEDARNL
ncbi:MAG: type IV pilus twitching motility protein PilT [Candidatus Omnitrophica bacterium]|nr:type IV pilus twitching motility protein PilT [Candidatus Omnitrophota bacterium]MBU4589374.1 type IV pilus twitching motility protein PilT [Candidatus Omnitrophota bacterium]